MKTINLKVQIKINEDKWPGPTEILLEDIFNEIETPIELGNIPYNHLKDVGFEVMIMDRNDK